jgi:hypothetical protein
MIYISLLFDIDLEFEHFSFMIKKLAKTHQILFDSYFNQLLIIWFICFLSFLIKFTPTC